MFGSYLIDPARTDSARVGSARAVPAPPRRVAPWSGSYAFSCACASLDVRPPSPQPCARTGRAVLPRVPHRSPIERSASGASAQQPGPSRSGVPGCGGDDGRGGASRQGWGVRGRAAPVRVRGVGRPPHPPDRAIRLRRNTAFAAWPRPGGADERPAAHTHAALRPRTPHPAALKAVDVLTASSQTPTPTLGVVYALILGFHLKHDIIVRCAGRTVTCCGRVDPDAINRVPPAEYEITVWTNPVLPTRRMYCGRFLERFMAVICAGRAATCCGRVDPDAINRIPPVEYEITVRTNPVSPTRRTCYGRFLEQFMAVICAGRAATCCGRMDPDAINRVPPVGCKITVRTKSMPPMEESCEAGIGGAAVPRRTAAPPTLLPLLRREREREQKENRP